MNIYVGNLSDEVTEDDLRKAFEAFGRVESAKVIIDQYSGKSKGFGFVEIPVRVEAQKAINELNGTEYNGQMLKVNMAHSGSKGRPRGGKRGRGSQGGGRRF